MYATICIVQHCQMLDIITSLLADPILIILDVIQVKFYHNMMLLKLAIFVKVSRSCYICSNMYFGIIVSQMKLFHCYFYPSLIQKQEKIFGQYHGLTTEELVHRCLQEMGDLDLYFCNVYHQWGIPGLGSSSSQSLHNCFSSIWTTHNVSPKWLSHISHELADRVPRLIRGHLRNYHSGHNLIYHGYRADREFNLALSGLICESCLSI